MIWIFERNFVPERRFNFLLQTSLPICPICYTYVMIGKVAVLQWSMIYEYRKRSTV